MSSIFKYLYAVGKYIEKEYDETIGRKVQGMSFNTVPIKIHDFVNKRYKDKTNIPNAAAELFFYIKATEKDEE